MKALIFISLLIFFLFINFYSYKFGKKFIVINYLFGLVTLLLILILFFQNDSNLDKVYNPPYYDGKKIVPGKFDE